MMTGGKVIVTYKRKRPPPKLAYKRRRLPLRDELHRKNESSDLNLAQTSIEPKVEQTTINLWECPIKGSKHAPEEKGHLYGSMKEELGQLAVAVKGSESENKNQNISNLMQLVTEPLAVLETNAGLSLKEDGLSVKDEASSLCINVATKRKLDTLLNTYQRRCKRKKDVNELQVQHGVGMNRDGPLESTSSIFTQEPTESKSGSEHPLVALKNPESSCPGAGSSCGSECFKPVADKKMEYIRSVDTSSVDINTQIAEVSHCPLDKNSGLEFQEDSLGNSSNDYTVDPALELVHTGLEFQEGPFKNTSNNATIDCSLEPVNSGLELQEDMLGNSFNNATVDPAFEPVSSGLHFQEGPLGNTSNNASAIDPTLQFPEGPLGNSSNDATIVSALEPVNSSLEFQEGPLGNSSNNDTVHPALEPVNSGLEFQDGPLGDSNNATVNPALEPVSSGLELQVGPLGNTLNDTVLEFPEGPLGNNATIESALEPVNSGLECQEGPLTNSSNKATVNPVLEPVSSGLEFQEGPLENPSNNASSIDPVLEFPVGPLGNSSNNATRVPALEPKNSGPEFQEGPLGNFSNCSTVDPSLEPVKSHLEFQEGPLGNLSNCATVDPSLEPVNSHLEFQGPIGNLSNNATIDPSLEPVNFDLKFQEGPSGNSSNNATVDPALEPVNSGLEFQEGPLGNSSINATMNHALKPVNSGLEFLEGPIGNSSNNVTVDGLEFQEGPLGNSSDNASVDHVLEPVNSALEFQEGPLGNSSNNATIDPALELQEGLLGNSLNNASVGPALEPVLFNEHSSTGEESPVLSGNAPNIGVTHEIPCSFQKESLDLSVPPSGACDSTSVHGENPLCISLDTPLGEHNAPLSDESPGVKRFDLLHENKPEAADGCSHHELTNSSPAGTSRSSYLQLFPEDRMDDLSRSTKMHERDTAGSSSRGKTVNPSETFGHERTAEAKSLQLYGLFLPMEVINDGHRYDSASSQWPIGGTQYRDFLRDGSSKDFPGQPSTSQRRRMVNRARTPKQHRLSPSSLYGYPTMWSEEELDSLWIGVRRYGRGNWEVMLRDPRLAFAPLRTPWDLALQWEQEQSKLLNNIPSVQGRHFRQSTVFQGLIGRQHLAEGVNLSLGDVYSGASLQTTTSMRPTQDAECSVSANSSTGRNCPHWLKEVVAPPPMPTGDTAAVRDRGNRAEIHGPGAGAGDLIVIDSDASSEETISDDRGGKM